MRYSPKTIVEYLGGLILAGGDRDGEPFTDCHGRGGSSEGPFLGLVMRLSRWAGVTVRAGWWLGSLRRFLILPGLFMVVAVRWFA